MEPILQFQGEFRFLSNFYIEPDGSCVENEYQAAKSADPGVKARFIGITPGQAKRLGRSIKIRPDWEVVKVFIMHELVRRKFKDHKSLTHKLLSTENRSLIEGNNWGDKFWGKINNGLGIGENNLGEILMLVREELS